MSGKSESSNQVNSAQKSQSQAASGKSNQLSDAELDGVAGGADHTIAVEGDVSVYVETPEVLPTIGKL